MATLVIAEHDNQQLKASTLNTLAAAKQFNSDIILLVAGYHCEAVAQQAAKIPEIKKVLVADALGYEHFLAENIADLVVSLAADYSHILAPASTFAKDFLPRVAALLDVGQISDVIKVISEDTFLRPIYAGNALATVQSQDKIKIATIRTSAFSAVAIANNSAPIEPISAVFNHPEVEFVRSELTVSERPELTSARVVISGGRGLQSGENFQLLEKIAKRLNAALGATRAAVDAGFVPNDYQVGQTGKVVAPQLYIAVGVSGAIQHLAGMKDSKVIVAINKDPDAPIFQIADYGLVGDLFEILPALDKELEKLGY